VNDPSGQWKGKALRVLTSISSSDQNAQTFPNRDLDARLGPRIHAHSLHPPDILFHGPVSYRWLRWLHDERPQHPPLLHGLFQPQCCNHWSQHRLHLHRRFLWPSLRRCHFRSSWPTACHFLGFSSHSRRCSASDCSAGYCYVCRCSRGPWVRERGVGNCWRSLFV
jgi:hypothetical protein